MEKIILPENHRRSVEASLKVVESHIDEIKNALINPNDSLFNQFDIDLSDSEIDEALKKIELVKQKMQTLKHKYNLSASQILLSRFINSQKSVIWLILSDTTTNKLKGYGTFPKEHIRDFDKDINDIKRLTDEIAR